jgi:hypothetical protein
MVRKAAIVQSNYNPWNGYFDLINRVEKLRCRPRRLDR